MSKHTVTGPLNGAQATFATTLGSSITPEDPGTVLQGELYLTHPIPLLDPDGIAVRPASHVDSRRCRMVTKGGWIFISWPVEDDTDMYSYGGTRRLWVQTPTSNVTFFQPSGECPGWLR